MLRSQAGARGRSGLLQALTARLRRFLQHEEDEEHDDADPAADAGVHADPDAAARLEADIEAETAKQATAVTAMDEVLSPPCVEEGLMAMWRDEECSDEEVEVDRDSDSEDEGQRYSAGGHPVQEIATEVAVNL